MTVRSSYFRVAVTKNCRKYHKRSYELSDHIDRRLVTFFEDYGVLEIYEFSKFNAESMDTFRIRLEDCWEVSGVLGSNLLIFTIAKNQIEIIDDFEKILSEWLNS